MYMIRFIPLFVAVSAMVNAAAIPTLPATGIEKSETALLQEPAAQLQSQSKNVAEQGQSDEHGPAKGLASADPFFGVVTTILQAIGLRRELASDGHPYGIKNIALNDKLGLVKERQVTTVEPLSGPFSGTVVGAGMDTAEKYLAGVGDGLNLGEQAEARVVGAAGSEAQGVAEEGTGSGSSGDASPIGGIIGKLA